MKNLPYSLLGLALAAIIFYFINRPKTYDLGEGIVEIGDGVFINTASKDIERLQKLGLSKPSVDVSNLLDESKLRYPTSASAKDLVLDKAFEHEAIIVLKSEHLFNSAVAWDAMQSVGLVWGDGDLFHWKNDSTSIGGDTHFSVWTSTKPGYFLPEGIRDGNFRPDDLVFGFSIPRSVDPERVQEAMLIAAKYCQKRLGGTLQNKYREPFNETMERKELSGLTKKMNDSGLIPGSTFALENY
jgi:FtsZ-interacting cell division protein ZipA